jgi:hypothetical protein
MRSQTFTEFPSSAATDSKGTPFESRLVANESQS